MRYYTVLIQRFLIGLSLTLFSILPAQGQAIRVYDAFSKLSDVTLTSPATGDTVRRSAGKWINSSTGVFTDQANTYSSTAGRAQTFKDNNFFIADDIDGTRRVQFVLDGLFPGMVRSIVVPNGDSVTVIPFDGSTHNFVTGITDDGLIALARPTIADLSPVAINTLLGGNATTGAVSEITVGPTLALSGATLGISTTGTPRVARLGLGLAADSVIPLLVSLNITTPLSGPSGTVAQFEGPNGDNARLVLDSYGGIPFVSYRRANGTSSSKTTAIAGDTLGSFGSMPFDGTAYPTVSGGAVAMKALNSHTGSDHSTFVDIETTAAGSITRVITKRFLPPTTFANAYATPWEGAEQDFTDSNTATWGATVAGGGSNHIQARFNGSVWTVVGK